VTLAALNGPAVGASMNIVDDAAFTDEVAALAARLAEGPALAYRLMKRAVAEGFENSFDDQLAVEAELQQKAGVSADFAEGIRAFKEKRPPRFEGR
jgi:2-(1,2-epoxy-1,2-dihydrophenyl)acetyl-CoA isomerase